MELRLPWTKLRAQSQKAPDDVCLNTEAESTLGHFVVIYLRRLNILFSPLLSMLKVY